ncbi:nucleolar pre-ribosomal-associated protein 1 [Saguinus oedipus]|uniref:Nucleolar pre-ribosomal-associated protein 1 n=1 Tax=Saguinus oedipus TaxID=9490 RepID=A0ABQ9TXL3_SAGOE|nr:nucleolar pre-ribosomal-associated protein 1 [Saguinus oedipus]
MESEMRSRIFYNQLCYNLCHHFKIGMLEQLSGEKTFTHLTQKTEQEWVFGLLRQGIRDKHCYELCARRGVFRIILSFFYSPLCDEAAQDPRGSEIAGEVCGLGLSLTGKGTFIRGHHSDRLSKAGLICSHRLEWQHTITFLKRRHQLLFTSGRVSASLSGCVLLGSDSFPGVPAAFRALKQGCGRLKAAALHFRFLETPLLSNVISLLHTLWVTNLGDKAAEWESQHPCQPSSREPPKRLALHLVNEFLYVLIVLVKHLRPTLAPAQLTNFFGTLDSVLRYRATVIQAFKDMNRFTVNETVLSTKDVLVLLHKWSLIERDLKLQEDLRAAIEKGQARELMKMLKDKNKPVMPARAKGPRGRKRRLGEAEDMADPELMASTLETCKGLLRSILTYWGPVIPGPDPTQEPVDSASPESAVRSPVYAAASLVVSWVLRSVAEHPPSRAEAAGLIGWLQSHILPHPVVVADLVRDGALRSSIFKLYSRLCGAEGLTGPVQEVACLFNTVMLQLVAAQGWAGSPFHLAMEALCLSSLSEKDEATRGETLGAGHVDGAERAPSEPWRPSTLLGSGHLMTSAAFLVSLYVKDVWLGAQRPDTLLTHIRMVCEAADDALSSEVEAIVVLCKDIASAASDA